MQTKGSQEIIERFFRCLQILKANKVIGGKQTFTTKYGINKGNFYQLEKNFEKDIFQVQWLNHLYSDYKVSAAWLLAGEGEFFMDGWNFAKVKTLQEHCKRKSA